MFDHYGPNSLQVTAYIEALGELTPDQFARIGIGDLESFISTLNSALAKSGRPGTRVDSFRIDALKAVQHHSDPAQKLVAALIASVFVCRTVFLIRRKMYFTTLSRAQSITRGCSRNIGRRIGQLSIFCEELTHYDGSEVFVLDRPDSRERPAQHYATPSSLVEGYRMWSNTPR